MAYIPDEAVLDQYEELTPAEMALFAYYCKVRNRKSGSFNCPAARVLKELKGMTRTSYFSARRGLVWKKWITASGNKVTPLKGFDSPKNGTESEDEKVPKTGLDSPENGTPATTHSPKNGTHSPKNGTDINRNIPTILPATLPEETTPPEKSFIPTDWKLSDDLREWAQQTVPILRIDLVAADFKNHFENPDKPNRKRGNWDSEFKTWALRENKKPGKGLTIHDEDSNGSSGIPAGVKIGEFSRHN